MVALLFLLIGVAFGQFVEKEHVYANEAGEELVGFLIYQDLPDSPKRPGLVVFVGPYGDGGGTYEREFARKYAAKGMVVFLPDYFAGRHSEDNQAEVADAIGKYPPFLEDTAAAQKIGLLALNQLKSLELVDADNVAAIGFCYGGSMTLNMARAGGAVKVAVSLHGEYPAKGELLGDWNVGYFVQMIGEQDPLIPADARNAWVAELKDHTADTDANYDVQIWGNSIHAFSLKYSDTFYGVLAGFLGSVVVPDGVAGVIQYEEERAEASFDRIDDLFVQHGLIDPPGRCSGDFLPPGLSCTSSVDCGGRGYCSPNSRTCKTSKGDGDYCNAIQKCARGLTCVEARCSRGN